MLSEAAVITILVKNSMDHQSPAILMAQAWESQFIQTVLMWRNEHPEIIVSFAAEVCSQLLAVLPAPRRRFSLHSSFCMGHSIKITIQIYYAMNSHYRRVPIRILFFTYLPLVQYASLNIEPNKILVDRLCQPQILNR